METGTNGFLTKSRASSIDSLYDKVGLNLKFERAFVLVLENILGLSPVTHYNRNSTTYYQRHSQWCPDSRVVALL